MQFSKLAEVSLLAALGLSTSARAQDNVYFGNLHAHTVYSDGSGTPDEAYQAAKQAGLDFIALTEHSHKQAEGAGDSVPLHIARDGSLYNGSQSASLISAAASWTVDGQFVAIYGQEYSTIKKGNHVNVFDVPKVIDVPNTEFRKLVEWTAANLDSSGKPALFQLNHPALNDEGNLEYGRDDFGSEAAWLRAMDAQAELIEVFNGPAMEKDSGNRSAAVQEEDYYYYLNLGFHLAPSVGHDNHYRTWGTVTDARVAVIAPQLTKTAVLEALRARHAYASSDKNLQLVFRSGAALQGDIAAVPISLEDDLPLTLRVIDADEPNANYRIDVFSDMPEGSPIDGRQPTNSFELTGDTPSALGLDGIPFRGAGQYVLVRVTQLRKDPEADDEFEDVAWTAPIWFGGANPSVGSVPAIALAPPSVLRLTRVLPDPVGRDLRNEKVWIRNDANTGINLNGWAIADLSGNIWKLSGRLGAGRERAYSRNGQDLSLNNGGDRLELRDPSGVVVQVVSYGSAGTGVEVPIP